MDNINLDEIIRSSLDIRSKYHELEVKHHGSKWTVEEDALAFLTDAGLVGRLVMAVEKRWPLGGDELGELKHKLGECIWWIVVLAERTEVGFDNALRQFFEQKVESLAELIDLSFELRQRFHEAEDEFHGCRWMVEEDALAFLTDAGLVGRNIMSLQGRWPKSDTISELSHKLGECIWWLVVLSFRTNIEIKEAVNDFIFKTKNRLK